jgi:hypothetical protein
VTVTGAAGEPAPTGQVTVTDGTALFDVYTLTLQPGDDGASHASTFVEKRVDHEIWAAYSGDATYAPARSATVRQPIYEMTMVPGPMPKAMSVGASFTMTARAYPNDPNDPPLIGYVTFSFENESVNGEVRDGVAEATLTARSAGTGGVELFYSGDDLYNGAPTDGGSVTIYPPGTPFPGSGPVGSGS